MLFLLGLLMFVPARTHRFLGALALLVSLVVGAAVLVPLADADWDVDRWAVGGWFTVAVAALGVLGALKALMTNARRLIRTAPRPGVAAAGGSPTSAPGRLGPAGRLLAAAPESAQSTRAPWARAKDTAWTTSSRAPVGSKPRQLTPSVSAPRRSAPRSRVFCSRACRRSARLRSAPAGRRR